MLLRFLGLITLAVSLAAQTVASGFKLNVRDPSGAPVQASGRIEGPAGRLSFSTDGQGAYEIGDLTPGRYHIEISKEGFATRSLDADVEAGSVAPISIVLSLNAQAYRVDVVATTPLPGVELARNDIPAPVQLALEQDVRQSGALDLSDFMNRRLQGVHLNEIEGNPYQADVNYRGYSASPLLGTPQGLSVYMDGVRLNQPFGDVVSWDLFPISHSARPF